MWKHLGSCRYQSLPWACCCVCRSVLASGCAFSLVLCLCLCVVSSLSGYLDAYTCVSLSSAPPFRCCSIVSSCSFVFRLWFLTIDLKKNLSFPFLPPRAPLESLSLQIRPFPENCQSSPEPQVHPTSAVVFRGCSTSCSFLKKE